MKINSKAVWLGRAVTRRVLDCYSWCATGWLLRRELRIKFLAVNKYPSEFLLRRWRVSRESRDSRDDNGEGRRPRSIQGKKRRQRKREREGSSLVIPDAFSRINFQGRPSIKPFLHCFWSRCRRSIEGRVKRQLSRSPRLDGYPRREQKRERERERKEGR